MTLFFLFDLVDLCITVLLRLSVDKKLCYLLIRSFDKPLKHHNLDQKINGIVQSCFHPWIALRRGFPQLQSRKWLACELVVGTNVTARVKE